MTKEIEPQMNADKRRFPSRSGASITPDADFEHLIAEPSLASARHALERVRERARRSMSADLEGLAVELEVIGGDPNVLLAQVFCDRDRGQPV